MPDLPLVLEADPLPPAPRAWLAERTRLVSAPPLDLLPIAARAGSPEWLALLAEAEGLVVRTATGVDAALLTAAPRLRVVGRAGVGLDHIDLAACRARSVAVVHTPDANTQAVVEYAWALILDAVRPRLFLDAPVDAPRWEQLRAELVAPRQLGEMVLGVYGFGRIGSRMARVAHALGMRTLYCDLLDIPPDRRFGAEPVSRETLLAEADILTVHVDGRPANRGLLDADAFGRLKSTAVFLNTARGLVVDELALAEFMIAHPGAQALLDVHAREPFDGSCPLLDIPNVHLAPHLASATETAKAAMGWVVRDVHVVLTGGAPAHRAV
jgi:phosphoglycerate dehydrogenase-like enzyme